MNAELLDPELPEASVGSLLVEEGRIAGRLDPSDVLPEGYERIDLFGKALAPGFIDLHYHGELVFAQPEALDVALARAAADLARGGTTAFLVTTMAWGPERLAAFFARAAELVDGARLSGAQPLGVHLEGPWINGAAAGAQPETGIRPYTAKEGEALFARGEGLVRMVTLAPEVEGASALLATLGRRGVVAALGHSRAAPDAIDAAVAEGMRHVTHLFNAMGPLHHRDPGVPGTAMADDRLTCDLICDGAHVHPHVVKLCARSLGERLVLITDQITLPEGGAATFGAGAVHDDGVALRLADGTLAGSSLSMERAVRNLQAYSGADRLEAVRAGTLRPARVLGVERERGCLRVRARADLVVLDEAGGVLETWVEGRRVYDAPD